MEMRTGMKLIKKFIPDNVKCDTKMKFAGGQPSVITIHWVGPYPDQTPDDVRDWWIKSNGEASAHFIVKEDEVMQCWPLDKIAWHAGCGAGNKSSIGIEVIPCNIQGRFSEKTISTLKELINTLPRLPLIRHYDWTGKDCPKFYVDSNEWHELLVKLDRPNGN